MIVFDLRCDGGHVFEAWFGSSADYAEQQARGLVRCPLCDSATVEKAVMAPNVAAKGNQRSPAEPAVPDAMKAALAALAKAQAKALEGSEWVGSRFADRARAMHLGEETTAPIHGQATIEEARALVDEGVSVAPLPLPVVPPSARN
ncbi:DUF1178 family protein [Sphingomonas sp. PL-96]|uniref:DUF1178 family protein n=1 Tax=Sphingomonas sp. PL-96 TaxID=2887201 RepID=UPI001E28334D|nr:DUF1178 family protein [Sphingomonas sp. PL-96]MCC2976381.1 DUF1178 family protein [Sphingomonas sp. PL-96]